MSIQSWSNNTGMSMCKSPWKNVAHEFVFDSLTMLYMSCLSYLNGLWGGRQVAVQLLFCRICSRQHPAFLCSFYIAFLLCVELFCVVHPYSSMDSATAWKESRFILSDRFDFSFTRPVLNKGNIGIKVFPSAEHSPQKFPKMWQLTRMENTFLFINLFIYLIA